MIDEFAYSIEFLMHIITYGFVHTLFKILISGKNGYCWTDGVRGDDMMLKLKRVYDDVSRQDGKRILVDGIWPRGIKKKDLQHDEWLKNIAPSTELRKWFDHDPEKWDEFREKYKQELDDHKEVLMQIKKDSDGHNVTLLYAAKDEKHNQAVVIKEYIEDLK